MHRHAAERDEVFQSIRFQILQLSTVVSHTDERKKSQWKDDADVLKAYVSALSATRTVLKEEQNNVLAKMNRLKTKKGRKGSKEESRENFLTKKEVQERLNEFRQRVKEAETRVEQAASNLSTAVKKEERCMLEDQITLMRVRDFELEAVLYMGGVQETRKLCLEEAQVLEMMLKEMEISEQRQKEEAADWQSLAHLKDQLTKLESKIDQAKRCLLFPSVHGYRFRVGTGGIYVGAKDLYVSDLSASFSFSVESVHLAEKSAVIRIHMGGREPRPTPLIITETDSGDDSVDVQSCDATEINNHPPSPLPEENTISSRLEEELEAEIASEGLHRVASDVDPEEDPLRASPPVIQTEEAMEEPPQDPLHSSHMEVQTLEAKEDHGNVFDGVQVDHPVSSISDDPPAHNVAPVLDGVSPGKNFAMKFLTKIADKSHLPKGVARASQALFFTQPHRTKVTRSSSGSQTLLKRFVLAPDSQPPRRDRTVIRLKTPLQYTSQTPPTDQHAFQEASEKLPATVDSPDLIDTTTELHELPANDSLSSSHGNKRVTEAVLGPHDTGHRRFESTGSLDRSDFFSKKSVSLSWKDSSSEIQSDTTSLIGAGRRGVHVKLQGSYVSIIGEKGTRVPNLTIRDIILEVECCLSVVFEFSEQQGWHSPHGLKFEVIQLRKKTIGNSVPLPTGLVKTILNLILPKIVEKALVSALPKELGSYVLESEKGMTAAGEVIVMGPPLSTTQARLNTPSPYTNTRTKAADVKAYSAVQEAQSLLSLSTDEAMLLGTCFSKEKWGLLNASEGWTGVCSIHELCRFYDRYAKTDIWLALCDLWNKALRHVAQIQGVACTLDFPALMNGTVARLAAKPVRTQCLFTRLNCQLNMDAFLLSLRDYCERSAREIHAEKPLSAAVPLDQQLKALHEWYANTKTKLVSFKAHFKSFMSAIVARADAKSLQIGLEKADYEGPLHFEMPIERDAHDSGMLSFDVSIPAPGDSGSSQFVESLSRALRAIHVFKNTESDQETDSKGEERRLEWGISSATGEKLEKVFQQDGDQPEENFQEALTLGRAFIQRLHTSITLNEDALAQKLFNGPALSSVAGIKSTLESLGDVVAGALIPVPGAKDAGSYTLTFQSSDYARFKCILDTLGFQSTVSPAEVFSMIHICTREYLSTFYKDDVMRQKTADHLFKQVIKYVDKRSLDVVFCSKLESLITNGRLMVSLSELDGSENGIRYPIQVTNDFDIISLMDTLTMAQGKLEA